MRGCERRNRTVGMAAAMAAQPETDSAEDVREKESGWRTSPND